MFNTRKDGTMRAVKNHPRGSKREQHSNFTLKTLGSGDITGAVKLPPGEDIHDWIAANTVDFFNELSLMWGIICENGVPVCEKGHGFPPGFQYFQSNGGSSIAAAMFKTNTATSCSGPEYVDWVINWVDKEINNGVLFPTNSATPFPRNFFQVVKVIYTRLFRVFAIVYYHHYSTLDELGAVSHLNTSFKHFVFFIWEHDLVSDSEQEALKDIISEIRMRYESQFPRHPRRAEVAIAEDSEFSFNDVGRENYK